MTTMPECLSEELLCQWSLGHWTPEEIEDVEQHVSQCKRCRERLTEAETDAFWKQEIVPALKNADDYPLPDKKLAQEEALPGASLQSVLSLLGPTDDPHMLGRIGSYEIAGVIGRGGMGIVFKAFDAALNRFVAIKMLLPHLAESGAARKRFEREGLAAAAVIDDHVLPIYNVAEWRGVPYLVSQYLRGATLQARIEDQGPLETKEVLRIAMQTARGLAAAHAQGLVHRDVKPSNILLNGAVDRAMLTDFGLARAGDDASITRTGLIAGTPQYMSPEQARGDVVNARSDLFSLGCVMYAMCTGRPPFRAESSYAVLRLITDHEPRPITEINPDIAPWLSWIISKLMYKKAEDRFDNAAEVAGLLEQCLAHLQQPTATPLPASLKTLEPHSRSQRQGSSLGRILIGCALAAAIVMAGIFITLELDKGTLTIESQVDDVKIRVTQGDEVVKELTVTRDASAVRIASGKYRVEIEGAADGLTVENGQVTLSRGGAAVVRVVRNKSLDKLPNTAASGSPGGEAVDAAWRRIIIGQSSEELTLLDAVGEFNRQQQADEFGKLQPKLTDEEVIASIRWAADELKPGQDKLMLEEIQQLQSIAVKRMLPSPWKLVVQTEVAGEAGERFRVWQPQVVLDRPDGSRFAHTLREHFLWPMVENGGPELLAETNPAAIPSDWRPLSAAIESFNDGHRSLGKIEMPPVTEAEIVAAIRFWKAKRSNFDVTSRDFDRLQAIARVRAVPPDAEISIITHFQPGDGCEYLIWSLRLHLKKTSNSSPYPQFGDIFRTHFVRVTRMDDGKIAWGPVASNGIQAGFRVEPRNERYTTGQSFTPRFYVRNTADTIKKSTFPNLMTHSYYKTLEVVDAAGNVIDVETNPDPSGPVGWIEMPFSFGAIHEIGGLPILLGTGGRGEAESAIRAKPGQSVRMRFTLHNYGDREAEALTTDWITFTLE